MACLEVAGVVDVLQDGCLCVQVRWHVDSNVLLAGWHQPDGYAQQICTAINASEELGCEVAYSVPLTIYC